MEAYLKAVMVMGAVCSVILYSLPHGSDGAGKYVKYISQLATLLVITTPVIGMLSFTAEIPLSVPERPALESEAHSTVIAKAAENISRFITDSCCDKFGLDSESVRVKLIIDESDTQDVKIEEIQLFCNEKRSEEKERIRKYFEELLETKVYVFGP